MKRIAAAGLLLLVACSSGGDANEVTMSAHAFEPATIAIQAGESIDWKNTSSEQHTVTADEETLPDGAPFFSSGDASDEKAANADLPAELLEVGEDYKFTFDSPGTYSYYCILHRSDGMEGKVVVEP